MKLTQSLCPACYEVIPAILSEEHEARAVIMAIHKDLAGREGAVLGGTPECDALLPLKHTFIDDGYMREIFMPKGMFVVSKIHKRTHPYFIMQGDVSVLTESGVVRIHAPFHGITKAGTKRVLYMHEDTVWITVHPTQETDLGKIEEDIIAKTFDDLDNVVEAEVQQFIKEVTK